MRKEKTREDQGIQIQHKAQVEAQFFKEKAENGTYLSGHRGEESRKEHIAHYRSLEGASVGL